MITKEKLYGVVVWYNPTLENVQAISTYINDVEKLFVIDNSEKINDVLLQELASPKVVYYSNGSNVGIATALNVGCEKALADGADWVLTMDQDSRFERFSVSDLVNEANLCPNFNQVGIFSPYHHCGDDKRKVRERFQTIHITMTSGNLLSMEAYQKCGRFRDDFFIDLVDDEYCCRLYTKGYIVVKLNDIIMTHNLGNGFVRVSPLLNKTFIQHNALRHYYIVRNLLEVRSMYPFEYKYYTKQLRKRLKRCLLYDSDQKWTKIKHMYWGWCDYKKRKFGKFIPRA